MPNNSQKKILIAMSVYNECDYIYDAIFSLKSALIEFRKRFPACEVIIGIVDDGSDDNCIQKIIPLIDDEFSPNIFRNQTSCGLAASLNTLISKYKCDFVFRFDGDDICCSERFICQFNFLLDHPECDILGCNAFFIDKYDHNFGFSNMPLTDYEIKSFMNIDSPLIHPSVVFKHDVWRELNGYNESFHRAQDFELWIRAKRNGFIFYNMPDICIKYRVDPFLKPNKIIKNSLLKIRIGWTQKQYILILNSLFIMFYRLIKCLNCSKATYD